MVNIVFTAFLVSVATWLGTYLPPRIIAYVKRKAKKRKKATPHRHGKKGGSRKKRR